MSLHHIINHKKIILGSQSPRRQAYLEELQIPFTVTSPQVDESYPSHLEGAAITDYIAQQKAEAISITDANQIVITSDTIVWHQGKALGKPKDYDEAFEILSSLSGKTHEVITSVCINALDKRVVFHDHTEVCFKVLDPLDIKFYIENYKPFDKAGAYGIQEWIGLIGITSIKGSYTNVVGLPTAKLVEALSNF